MAKYRVAMIGVGKISGHHKKLLDKAADRCEVIGMYDINPETLKKKGEGWGVNAFGSMDDLLAEKPDVCWVMTPVEPRIEIFEQCFNAGCHVFTEKPLALNNEDAAACVKLAEDAGMILGFGCNERHLPPSYTMAQEFFSGALGRLVKVYAQTYIHREDEFWAIKYTQSDAWRLTFDACGGRIFEFSIHLVNWIQWIGSDPEYVMGVNDAVSDTLVKNGLDDVVSCMVKFRQGYGVVETIMAPGNHRKIRRDMGIIGTKGECWYDENEKKVRVVVPSEGRDEFIEPIKCPTKAEDMFDAMDKGVVPANDGVAALATTRICVAFNESVREKKVVFLEGEKVEICV